MSAVELRGFGWRHAGRKAWAVRGVDLRIERGERVLLLGPSGAGKSTLLAALAGLLADDSGEREGTAEIDGLDTRKARERVGIVFQDPATQLVMSRVGDDVAFGLENRGVPASGDLAAGAARRSARSASAHPLDRPTHALSGGEQQRLALAGVLALRPDLLLLDEPTANLDPAGADLVRASLRAAVSRDTTVIMVEHRLGRGRAVRRPGRRAGARRRGGRVRPAGPRCSATHGAALAADGIWVPGRPLPAAPPGGSALPATCWSPPTGWRWRPGWHRPTWRCAPARRSPCSGPTAPASRRWRCCSAGCSSRPRVGWWRRRCWPGTTRAARRTAGGPPI